MKRERKFIILHFQEQKNRCLKVCQRHILRKEVKKATSILGIKDSFVLTIVGSGSKDYKRILKSLVAKCDLDNKTNFIDDIPNKKVPELLRENDIFCMPSRSESFGVAALEAMACGLPVIASNVGGLKDIITDGFNGYLLMKI